MREVNVRDLIERLTERDVAILRSLRTYRLASTAQLRRLHFTESFASQSVATRAAQRVLVRLQSQRLVIPLTQRIGGIHGGSNSRVWQLDITGDRLLSIYDGDQRRRYSEPGRGFIGHTVAVTELAVRLIEAERAGSFDTVSLGTEPGNWTRFLGRHGQPETLKPDLTAVITHGDFEDHWYLERDLATEAPSAVMRQVQIYQRYLTTGAYQADHGIFPAVLWVVPDQPRLEALRRALAKEKALTPGIHRFTKEADFLATILGGSSPPPPDPPDRADTTPNHPNERNTP